MMESERAAQARESLRWLTNREFVGLWREMAGMIRAGELMSWEEIMLTLSDIAARRAQPEDMEESHE